MASTHYPSYRGGYGVEQAVKVCLEKTISRQISNKIGGFLVGKREKIKVIVNRKQIERELGDNMRKLPMKEGLNLLKVGQVIVAQIGAETRTYQVTGLREKVFLRDNNALLAADYDALRREGVVHDTSGTAQIRAVYAPRKGGR